MKRVLFAAVLMLGLYQTIQTLRGPSALPPLEPVPYVHIYGRDSCGYTQAMRRALEQAGIPYRYASVDTPAVADALHARMDAAGLDTSDYLLPVVDLSGRLQSRPEASALVDDFLSASTAP